MTDAPGRRRRRPHAALGGRIAATGLGATTLFGLVAAMGIGGQDDGSTTLTVSPPATAPTRTVIVVHHPVPSGSTGEVSAAPAGPSAPTALTARPVVRPAPPAPVSAPTARTSGSR